LTREERAPPFPAPKGPEADLAGYLGSDSCRPCHPSQFAQHSASAHAHTLRYMTRADLGKLCPPPGRIKDTQYSLVESGGRFYFEVDVPGRPDQYQLWPIDYVFGSGSLGISFVCMLEGRNVVEMRMSYFPRM